MNFMFYYFIEDISYRVVICYLFIDNKYMYVFCVKGKQKQQILYVFVMIFGILIFVCCFVDVGEGFFMKFGMGKRLLYLKFKM